MIVPKGITHRFAIAPGPQYYWMYESFAGDPEKGESATTGRFLTHAARATTAFRARSTRATAGRFEIISKVEGVYTRRVHATHPFDAVGWRGDCFPTSSRWRTCAP